MLAACGGGNSAAAGAAPTTTSSPRQQASQGNADQGAAGTTGGLTITTHKGSLGTYLTDGQGRALYLWVRDGKNASACSGSCADAWPPLTTTGKPHADGSAKAADLGTITRTDGSRQITYDGHALYYYAGDTGADSTSGQGSDGFGAKWWLVAPSGQAITSTGAAKSGSGYGNYGY